MRRQVVSAFAIVLALGLAAPSVDAAVKAFGDYTLDWNLDLNLFTWPEENPEDFFLPPECPFDERPTVTEIDKYPSRMEKDKNVTLGGYVKTQAGQPVVGTAVQVFLNATKTEPGILMGTATTDGAGRFELTARVPVDAEAQKYHLVNHAEELLEGCIKYLEAWSDPEVGVYAGAVVTAECPAQVFDGRVLGCTLTVKDTVGGPVPNRRVDVLIDGRAVDPVTTGADGVVSYQAPVVPRGTHSIKFLFRGDGYYKGGETTVSFRVTGAELQLDAQRVVRGETARLAGAVSGPPETPGKTLRVAVTGLPLTAAGCAASCDPIGAEDVTIGPDSTFGIDVTSSRDAPPAKGAMTVSGPFLDAPKTVPVYLVKGTALALDAPRFAGEKHTLRVEGRLVDDTGAPVAGRDLTLFVLRDGTGPNHVARTDSDGVARWEVQDLARGGYLLSARFEGTDTENAATAESNVRVVLPWYVWAIGVLALAGAVVMWRWARSLWHHFHPLPPVPLPALAFQFAEPADGAPETVAPGEAVTVELAPHPGATAFRVIAPAQYAGATEVPIAADAATLLRMTVLEKGADGFHVRAVDADGRELAEAFVPARAVEYAEEVEAQYRALVRERLGRDAALRITPRQFEEFLVAGRPNMARDTLERLVSIFEVADYSDHPLARSDFLAFVEARHALVVAELTTPDVAASEPAFAPAGVSAHPT